MRQTRPWEWSTAQITPSPAAMAAGKPFGRDTDAVCVTVAGSNSTTCGVSVATTSQRASSATTGENAAA